MNKIGLIALFCLCAYASTASHILGGEIHCKHLGTTASGLDSFKIVLKVYRDCNAGNAAFDNPVSIAIYDYNGSTPEFITAIDMFLPINSTDTLSAVPGYCLNIPPNVCVEEAVYETIIVLGPTAVGYDFCWQRCCWSAATVNLVSPADYGISLNAHIPGGANSVNSNPFFLNTPPPVFCSGYPVALDLSAFDTDGDSLSYELCSPYAGGTVTNPSPIPSMPPPYGTVNFPSPLTGLNPLPAFPALQLNSATGLLTGTPNALGQFAYGFCVKEYRDGFLLSETRRVASVSVIACMPLTISAITGDTAICIGDTISLNVATNGAVVEWVGNSAISDSSSKNPFVYPDSSTFYTAVVHFDSTCVDTAVVNVEVYSDVTASISSDTIIISGQQVLIEATGGISYNWMPDNGLSSTVGSAVTASPTVTTTYTVIVSVGSCSDSASIVVNVLPNGLAEMPEYDINVTNPSSGIIFVTLPPFYEQSAEFEIYSLTGERQTGVYYECLASVCRIDVTTLPSGMFLLRVKTNEDTQFLKVEITN